MLEWLEVRFFIDVKETLADQDNNALTPTVAGYYGKTPARQVGNAVERTKVLWRESVQDFVRQYGNLELNSLWHAQP